MELEKDWRQKHHFPYEHTNDEPGYQKSLVEDICGTAKAGGTILINASTGIGKTIAMVSSAFTLLEDEASGIERVIICPSNKSQHENIQKEIFRTVMHYPKLKKYACVALRGKRDLCTHEKAGDAVEDFCRYLRKDRLCQHFNALTDKTIRAKKCEYYKRVREAKEADILIADYSYLLDETYFPIIQSGTSLADTLVVFDEAHNLISRAIATLSGQKTKNSFEASLTELKTCLAGVKQAIEKENEPEAITDLKEDETDIKAAAMVIERLHKLLENEAGKMNAGQKEELAFKALMAKAGLSEDDIKFAAGILDLQADYIEGMKEGQRVHIRSLSIFLESLLRNSGKPEYISYLELIQRQEEKYYAYTLQCLDPSIALHHLMACKTPMVLMSGTMEPFDYYKQTLGLEGANEASYEADFLKINRKILLYCPEYANFKSEFRYKQIEVKIRDMELLLNSLPGNTACFFQSFSDAYNYHRLFSDREIPKSIHLHVQGGDRDNVLEQFMKSRNSILLSVSRSGLAEGIDYEGEALKNAVIVGVPYPSYDLIARAQIKYYTKKFGPAKARRYAYECPTLVTIQQAAGRVVRGPKERGLIILFDTRFRQMALPREYLENSMSSRAALLEAAAKFWEKESWKNVFKG